jgi:hypothetical protein
MSVLHDNTQYGAFKDLLEDTRAPDMDINEYKMEVLEVMQSSTGTVLVLHKGGTF